MPNHIRTVSGIYIDVFDPHECEISINDIAHALSQMPRFGGHLPVFYSVAQHSIFCAENAGGKDRLTALLHDATEAYLTDMPSPIKGRLPNYKECEDNLMKVIAKRFGLEYPFNAQIKTLDKYALEFEYNYLFEQRQGTQQNMLCVKELFINKFYEYGGE